MYPDGFDRMATFDFGYLDTILEGAQRPGHFKGVGQIVARLLDIVKPQYLYLGQKDYQQCMVIKRLLEMTGKAESVQIVICPTIREADGLAMSSRNIRLTEPQRILAGTLYQCLVSIQGKQQSDNFMLVQKECIDLLRDKGFEPEYVMLADADDLTLLENFDAEKRMVALIAARIGNVRLIDNLLLNPALLN
jgi:pantoate--beta-alanine ligase